MISPLFMIITSSFIFKSNLSISSKLCNVARLTVEPSISVGSTSATGVIIPVRPTCKVIAFSFVVFSTAGNL